MVCKAILNTGLALCLVFQASAPCCCAFQPPPPEEGGGIHQHRCHGCPESTPADPPSSDCGICSALEQVFDFPGSSSELPDNHMLAAWPFQPSPATRRGGHVPLLGPVWDTTPWCDIYVMQTLRE